MKQSGDECRENGHDEHQKVDSRSPCITGYDVTHSLDRSTVDVIRVCAYVTNTATVAESLNSHIIQKN